MDLIIAEVRKAVAAKMELGALGLALTLPDICASLCASDGQTSGARYQKWLTDYGWPASDAQLIYRFRCSLLHNGSMHPHNSGDRIAFVVGNPNGNVFHNIRLKEAGNPMVLFIDARMFTEEIAVKAESWFERIALSQT